MLFWTKILFCLVTSQAHHSFLDALLVFRECFPSTLYVVDVGVQALTHPLIQAFPECHHYLFEPVLAYQSQIAANYAHISHDLIAKAVSDSNNLLYQHVLSMDRSGIATHSRLSEWPKPDTAIAEFCIETIRTPVVSLDEELVILLQRPQFSFIVKIDIDGLDTDVMRGMSLLACRCALLIVECPLKLLPERVALADELGFDVFDITSPGYYYNKLSQVDVFFLNRALAAIEPSFNPWMQKGGVVDWGHWIHLD